MPIRARHVLLCGWLAAAAPAFAGTHTVTLYADLGNDPATGCTVTTSAGSFAGAELALDTTVVTDTSGAQVTRVEQRRCGAGVFGPPQPVDAGSWPAGLGNGDGGTAAIETYLPLSSLGGASVLRVGLFSAAEGGGVDAMLAAPGGGPILIELGAVVDIPTLSGALLVLLAAALGFFGWIAAGRRGSPLLAVLLLLGGSAALFAAVLRDGQTGDWAGQPLRGTDPAWDAPVNADLRSLYAQVEGPALFLRIDTSIEPDSSGANAAPQVNAGANVLAPINQPPTLTGTVTDDGLPEPPGALTLAWTQVSGEGTATFGSPAAAVTTTRFSAVGTYVLRLTANDGELSASDEVTVFVDMAAENVAPTLDPVPDRTVAPNTTLSLGLVGRDGNPFDALTYALVSGPAGASVAPQGVFAFTPTPAQLGGHSVTVQVADPGGLSAQATFQVMVAEGNHPPVLDPLADEVAATGARWTRGVTARDPDPGDPLTFTLLSGPAGMTLTGQQLSWTPAPDQTGAFPVHIQVTDAAGAGDEGDFTVSIPLPGAPVAHDDRYEVRRGETLDVSAPGVLANDVEPAGGALTATRLGDPDKGAVTAFGADGSFTYEAPPAEPPPPPLDVELRADWPVANLYNGPLVGDFDGDGGSDTVVYAQHAQILVLRSDGSVLASHDGLLPAPNGDCVVDAPPGQGVLADVDDDGKVELVTVANCKRDYPEGPGIYGGNGRLIAFSYQPPAGAGPGGLAVDWLSPLVASDHAAAYAALGSVKLTVARLAPSEPPSILWGVERAPHTASCGTLVPGAGDAHCRVVTVHRGSDGTILRRLYDVPANPNGWGFTLISGKSAPIAADLDADGVPEVVYNGTIWDGSGAVRVHLDGLPGPHLPIVDAAVADLDGDGAPEILGLSTQWAHTDGYLRAFRADGSLLWHFAVYRSTVQSSLSVADVDRDGSPEALFSVWADLFVVDARGRLKWLRSFADGGGSATIAHGSLPARYPVYDLDGDGLPEVIVQDGAHDVVFLRGDNGEEQARWHAPGRPHGSLSYSAQSPTVADLDGDGAAEALFLLNANDGNPSRVITLRGITPWRAAPRTYHGRGALGAGVAEDGSVPSVPPAFWQDPATNRFDQPAPRPYTVDPRLRAQTSFPYRAHGAHHDSPPATVTIDLVPDNRPPVVTSTPPASAHRSSVSPGTPLTYQITAVDPDLGDVISYQLVLAGCGTPGAASVDASTGLFRYAAAVHAETTCTFGVRLSDGQGGNTYHGFAVTFTSETRTVPNLVGQRETLVLTVLAAAELAGGRVSRMPSPAPAGEVIAQTPLAGASALRNSAVDYGVSTGPAPEDRDDDGDGTSESQGDCDDTNPARHPGAIEIPGNGVDENCDGTERNVAELRIEPGAATRATGEEIAFTATAVYDDGTAGDVTASAAWISSAPGVATLDATGRARALSAGSTAITAGFGGVIGHASLAVRSRNAGDQEAPTALITAPADGGTITGLAQVTGIATDANFLRYELAIAAAGEPGFVAIGEGTAPVAGGLLGLLDPTQLVNDIYTLRLTVWDTNGNENTAEIAVVIEGGLKIGNFRLGFLDLALPLAGIPIEVVRSYDSRDPRPGDFGAGWRLQERSVRLSTNGALGNGWRVVKPGLTFGLLPTREHFVAVSMPEGRVERFDLSITPTGSFLVPLSAVRAAFVPRPGTLGRLESLENTSLLIADAQPGVVELLDDTTLGTYDPRLFRYTTADGTQVEIHRIDGVRKITDLNGNAITFGPAGMTHSAGKSVSFTRDAQQRITRITDPAGNSQSYLYDDRGDLIAHTDANGNTTRFRYDRRHGLLEVQDPLGRPVARNEYDESGRLVASIDPEGRRTAFEHDLTAREELITDTRRSVRRLLYDERGNVTTDQRSVTIEGVPTLATSSFTYDADGNVLSSVDPDGLRTESAYSGPRRLSEVVDPGGLRLSSAYTYDAADNLITSTDPAGRSYALSYDGNRNLTRIETPQNGASSNVVDARGLPVRIVDALGVATVWTRDGFGHVIREEVFDPASTRLRRIDFTYDGNGNRLSETLHRTIDGVSTALTTSMAYDAGNRLVAITDPAGGITRIEYDAAGREAARIDPLGRRTAFAYDASGRWAATTYPDGERETAVYDGEGHLVASTDRAGRTTSFEYDELGRKVATTYPGGATLRTVYSAGGRVMATIDARGGRTDYSYDTAGRRTGITLPEVEDGSLHVLTRPQLVQELDENGVPTASIDANGHRTLFTYDAGGRLERTTFADGSFVTRQYDALGRLVTLTNEDGQTVSYTFDGLSRLAGVAGLRGSASYTYDEAGNLLTMTDALGRITRFRYDVLGRLIEKRYPGGGQERFSYDAGGNLVARTDPLGHTTTFERDGLGRLTRKLYFDGTSISYSYTATGQRKSVADARGITTYSYDEAGRLAGVTSPTGEILSYTRDANGNLLSLTSPSAQVSFSYDALNRLVAVAAPEGESRYAYDPAGNRVRLTTANGLIAEYAYDQRNRPTEVVHRTGGGAVLQSFRSTYSATGRRTRVTEFDGSIETYGYDDQGRVISEIRTGTNPFSISHSYDAVGNRTQTVRNGVHTLFTYDADDRLLSADGATYSYDANGNLISRNAGALTTQYAYDPEDRLVRVEDASGTTRFAYDADGNRIEVTSPTEATRFLVDSENVTGLSQVLEEIDAGSGSPLTRYTYGIDRLTMVRGGTTRVYHHDAHGSARLLTSSAGIITDRYGFDAYGSSVEALGSSGNPYLYSGERLEGGTGYYALRARDYDPAIGRFTSRDPFQGRLDWPQTLHRYNYAHGDPVNGIDPTGQNTVQETAVVQYIGNLGSFTELVGKLRAACGAKTTLDQVNELMFFSTIAVQAATLSMASLFPSEFTQESNGKPQLTVSAAVKSEIPLFEVKKEGDKAKSGIQRFAISTLLGGGARFGLRFELDIASAGRVGLEITRPPLKVVGLGGVFYQLDKPILTFRECEVVEVGDVSLVTSLKGGLGTNGGAAALGIAAGVDLRLSLFGGSFRTSIPLVTIDPGRIQGKGHINVMGIAFDFSDSH